MTILCIGYLNIVDMSQDKYEILEFFAGERRLARLANDLGRPTASMDKMYDSANNIDATNCMDLNTSAGFTFLS